MTLNPEIYMIEEAVLSLIPVLVSGIPGTLLNIASYVLSSMALYTLATRRGINKAWLSWVPVLNVWIIGSLSDQYRYVVKGQYKSKRKVLLIMYLAVLVLGIGAAVTGIAMLVDILGGAVYGVLEREMAKLIMGPALRVLLFVLPIICLTVAMAVVRFMAMYDIYTSMDPENSVMFLVLSILFHITEPFFLFFSRNKDAGMPPRKQEPVPEQPQWLPQEPAAEPWEENKNYL